MATISTFSDASLLLHPQGEWVTVADATKVNEVTLPTKSARFSFFPVGATGYLTWSQFAGTGVTLADGAALPAKYLTLPANVWTPVLFIPRHATGTAKLLASFFLGAAVNGTVIQVIWEDDTGGSRT